MSVGMPRRRDFRRPYVNFPVFSGVSRGFRIVYKPSPQLSGSVSLLGWRLASHEAPFAGGEKRSESSERGGVLLERRESGPRRLLPGSESSKTHGIGPFRTFVAG